MAVDFLSETKARLGVVGDYHDATLQGYIEDVKAYLRDAGVPDAVLEGEEAVGAVARGVADLWNYGAGEAKLSSVFMQRAVQLVAKGLEEGSRWPTGPRAPSPCRWPSSRPPRARSTGWS